MIQFHLMDKLKEALPDLEWSGDYRSGTDNVGTVYYEGGADRGRYDVPYRHPRYMVYISSSDWDYAEYAANKAADLLHMYENPSIVVEYYQKDRLIDSKELHLQKLFQQGDVNRIGVENGIMDYSVNFEAHIIEYKEAT